MSNSRNIRIVEKGYAPLYLYTQWGANNLEESLRRSLTRSRDRWNDPSYLTRIIFSDMIFANERETTGFGISTSKTSTDVSDIVVYMESNEIKVCGKKYTFDSYIS